MSEVQKISFVDSGQDFTEFYVREGVVIDCQPAQGRFWVGTKVVSQANVGQFIEIVSRASGCNTFLQHKVESVETLAAPKAEEAKLVAYEWVRRLKIEPAELGL